MTQCDPGDLTILIDCVLGLPSEILRSHGFEVSLRRLERIEQLDPRAPFGREASQHFFSEILEQGWRPAPGGSRPYPERAAEQLAGANSVFRTHPFQKNIQTGTYRIWRELSRCRRSVRLWPFEGSENSGYSGARLHEGYPSLLWREYLEFKARTPQKLPACLRARGVQLSSAAARQIASNADLADAAVLAFGGFLLKTRGLLGPVDHPKARTEGWIAGLSPQATTRATSTASRPRSR
jgi:hypothetical protein